MQLYLALSSLGELSVLLYPVALFMNMSQNVLGQLPIGQLPSRTNPNWDNSPLVLVGSFLCGDLSRWGVVLMGSSPGGELS